MLFSLGAYPYRQQRKFSEELLWLQAVYAAVKKARAQGLMSLERDLNDPTNSLLFRRVWSNLHTLEFVTDVLSLMTKGNLNAQELGPLMLDAEAAWIQAAGEKAQEVAPRLKACRTLLWASMLGYSPETAAEMARMTLPVSLRMPRDEFARWLHEETKDETLLGF